MERLHFQETFLKIWSTVIHYCNVYTISLNQMLLALYIHEYIFFNPIVSNEGWYRDRQCVTIGSSNRIDLVPNRSQTGASIIHYDDVIMGAMASQITSLTIVYSTIYSGADQRKHQSSASLAFVRGIHRGPVNSPHKWPVTRKMFPFDDVIMSWWRHQIEMIFCVTDPLWREFTGHLRTVSEI